MTRKDSRRDAPRSVSTDQHARATAGSTQLLVAEPASAQRPELTDGEDASVLVLLRTTAILTRRIDADLLAEHGTSLNEFRALLSLSEAPQSRLRMTELAGATGLSASGLTRLVNSLQLAGLVRRARSSDDGRRLIAVLTKCGLRELQLLQRAYARSARRHLLDRVPGLELRAFVAVLQQAVEGDGAATTTSPAADQASMTAH